MKTMKPNFLFALICASLFIISCEKDAHDEDCHACHIALIMEDGCEHEYEIDEFCGDELSNIEANGYTVTADFTHMGITYSVGHGFDASDVHCEEHADH